MSEVLDVRGSQLEENVARAAEALRRGELVVMPTDTVYGVAADAFSPTATRRLYAVKGRSRRYPLPVVVRSPKQVPALVAEVPPAAERLMAAYWPGPLTIVMHEQPGLIWDIGDNDATVSLRMPQDDIALEVIRAVGPLAVTSANRAGQAPGVDIATVRGALGDDVDLYLDGGPRRGARPSTIVDLTRAEPLLVRDGDLPPDEVMDVARGVDAADAPSTGERHGETSVPDPGTGAAEADGGAEGDERG